MDLRIRQQRTRQAFGAAIEPLPRPRQHILGGGQRPRRNENVEKPRTDDNAVSAEGREQPPITPEVETTPKPVADAPDTTTPKQQVEDLTKLDQSGDPSQEKSDN